MVRSPWQAASATLALKSGEWVLLFRLIASLLSISLILREALTAVQSLSSQWGSIYARALYKDSDVIICKEVKSALDNQTEQKIVKKVGQMHGNQSRFLIAHRLTGLKNVTVYSG